MARITKHNNPDLYNKLYGLWVEERHPGWVVLRAGGDTYKVVQVTSGSIAFDAKSMQGLYETTSFN
jgi:hypothetical protein